MIRGLLRKWLLGEIAETEMECKKSLSAIDQKIDDLLHSNIQLKAVLKSSVLILADVRDEADEVEETAERASEHIKKMEMALSSARDQIRLLEEVTIPGLVSSQQILIDRWEAESRVQQIRANVSAETVRHE